MPISSPERPGTRRRLGRVAALAGVIGLAGSLALTAVPAAADQRPLEFDRGHVDAFNLALVDGTPTLNLKEDVTGSHVPHAPEDVNLVVTDAALTDFPSSASGFVPDELLGTAAHYLPLTQDPSLLWPGWDSLQLGSAWNKVDIHVTDVDGPGDVFVWSQGPFGGMRSLLNGGGYELPGTIHQGALAHVHANWAFTQPGEYVVTVHADVWNSGTDASATTNEATYLFTVGAQTPPTSVSVEGLAESYLPGSTVELRASADVSLRNATYRWESSVDGATWVEVPGQTSDTYSGVVQDGQQLRASITARGVTVHSEPVTTNELAAGSVTIQGLSNPYLPNSTVELSAITDVQVPGATYLWETSSDGADWVAVPDQTGPVAGLPAVDGQQVRVTHISGARTATSEPVVVELIDLPTTLTLSGLAESYAAGENVVLEAKPDVLVDGGVFSWETSTDATSWTPVVDAAGSVVTLPAAAQQVRATYSAYGTRVVSAPVTITIAAPAPTSVAITGLSNPYEPGTDVTLTAVVDGVLTGATFQWETSSDAATWNPVVGGTGSSLTVPAVGGQHIRVTVSGSGWSRASTPVVVALATEVPLPEEATSVAITGLESSYAPDATVTLTATTDRPAVGATYSWQTFTTPLDGAASWTPITGQTGRTYSAAAVDGQRLRVVVQTGARTLTSAPVTVVVSQAPPGQCWALDIDHGHVDTFSIGLGGTDDLPHLELKEDVTGQRVAHAAEEVNLVVKESALTTLPAVAGVPAPLQGSSAYYLPLTQDANLLWPGWDSLELAPGGWGSTDIAITQVEGPGEVYVWSNSSFGGATALLDDGRFQLPGTIHQSSLAHVHANWAFTEPGAYFVTATATAHKSGGVSHTTNTGTYLFTVGDADLPEGYRDCVAPPAVDPAAPASTELTDQARGDVSVHPQQVHAGEQATVSVRSGLAATAVAAFLHSDPVLVTSGWTQVDAEGRFLVTVPASAQPGAHRVSVVDAENLLVGWTDLEVLPARQALVPPPAIQPSPGNPGTGNPGDPGNRPSDGTTPPGDGITPVSNGGAGAGGSSGKSGAQPVCLPTAPATPAASAGAGGSPAPAGASTTATPGEVVVGSEGHFDFGPLVQDGDFQIQVKDDRTAPPVWRQPETVVFDIGAPALRKAADIPAELGFVAPAGQDVYMIQQIQEAGVPWIGFNTQHETIVNGPGSNGATLSLDKAEGPGEVAIFLNGNFGQLVGQRVVDTVGGPTSYTIPANTHQHGNWVFTEAGVYVLTFTISADGESDTTTLRFAVGQADPAAAGAGAPAAATADGASSKESATSGEAKPAAGQGRTASGQPCTLASTGVDTDPGSLALVGLLAVMTGAALHVAAKRRGAGSRRQPLV